MRRPLGRRVVALLLSWVVPATSAWAVAPPVVGAAGPSSLRLSVVPGLAAALERAALEAQDGGGDRDDRDDRDDRKDRDRGDKDRDKPRRPILVRCECVEDEGDGTYTAHFGYESQNAGAVTIGSGPGNQIVPPPSRRDQPTRFLPGRSRGWPEAPFRLRFDGKPVTWMLKGPDGVVQRATASPQLPRCGANPPPCANPFWGPKRFEVKARAEADNRDRDDGRDKDWDDRDHRGHQHKAGDRCDRDDDDDPHKRPTTYEETITLPAGIAPPYRLTVVNGSAGLKQRVLLGSVFVDGRLVIGPRYLNPLVRQVTREVALKPASRLKLRLVGLPGSHVTLSICGSSVADGTPPTIAITDPAAGALLADSTPSLRVAYADPAGAGVASGVDPATLVVTLDGQDRTAWFTRTASEATAEVPADALLTEGAHRLEARIRDAAGNQGVTTPVEFKVDSLAPVVTIAQPQDGTFVSAATVDVSGSVADASPIVRLRIGGVDAAVVGSSFTAAGIPIGDGPEVTIEAEAEDAAGNVGRATVHLRVDRRTPTVTITRPAEGDTVQGPLVEVEGTVDDDSDVRVEVNGTPEDPPPALRAPRGFRAHVPITDGTTRLTATARDAAGNSASSVVNVRTDTVPPTVVIDAPAPGLVTKETSVHVEGRATDASGIASVTVDGVPAVVASDGTFGADVPLGGEGEQTITVVATDNGSNATPASVTVTIDRTPPPVFTIASPAADAFLGSQPVLVQGTVEDPHLERVTVDGVTATVTGLAWQVLVDGLGDGPHTFSAVARDRAGNETPLTRSVRLDTGFPIVTITAPADSSLLRDGAITVTGTVRDATLQSLRVNGLPAVVTGDPASPEGAIFTLASLPLAEGGNVVEAVAEDGLARHGSAQVSVVRDSQPPIVELAATSLLVRGRAEKAIASASDGTGSGVAQVVFLIDGQPVATLGQPPFEIPLEAPATLASGQSFTVAAQATDLAGNVGALVSRAVTVVSEGVVVGQVLADETSLPLAGASVRLLGAAGSPSVTDARGRYTLPVQSASALVLAEAVGRTSVERELPVSVGTGAVPVDARLAALAAAVSVGPGGGAATAAVPGGSLSVTVPSGAVAADTGVRLTPLSPQGLPGLLPLGWSPLAAFDLRTSDGATLTGPLAVRLAAAGAAATSFAGWPAAPAVLAEYRPVLHAWVLVEAGLLPTAGELTFSLPGPGAFALVVPDAGDPAPVIPAAGQALGAVPLAELPATAASRALVQPAVLPPSGGTASGTLVVDSPLPLPSGTVVQARVTETFSLASGETASEDERPMDIVLFRAPCTGLGETGGVSTACPDTGAAAIAAQVPLTPSRTFGTAELLEGRVHLDILAGRESARGTTGGAAPVVVQSGEARLSVAGLALARDTAIALREETLSSFLPSGAGLEPVAEVTVDFSGAVLQHAAELQVAATGADGTFVVARVERVDGVPQLAVVAMAAMVGDRLVTQPSAILPGVRREGRHVFYRLAGPVGFVRGVTSTAAGGEQAVVTADGLPFIAASEPSGAYVLTTLPSAAVAVRARIPGTPLQAEAGPVEVTAGEATGLDLLLSGASTTARVVPPNGSAGIAVNARLEVVPTVPLDPASVAAAVVQFVRASDSQVVPLRLVVGVGGRSLSIIPERKVGDEFVPLEFATAYRLTASGLRDTYGTPVVVPPSSFTTAAFVAPVLDTAKLVFDVPDENGIVTVHAPAGSYPPGTTVLIVNSGNGVVLSLTADNDGAVDGELPASVDDRLLVTITDPQGNAKTFERSQYVVDAATGETAVGAGGGVVTSPDAPGYELRVPKDATGQAVHLRIKALTLSDFPELPALPDAEFGTALEVHSPQRPTFKKEVDLAFPLSSLPPLPPDAKPEDAYYSVVREIKGASGETYFQTIDEAKVECPEGKPTCDAAEKKVVTASFPFGGFVTPFGALTAAFGIMALETARFLLMRTFNAALPSKSQWGVITGRVLQPVPIAGKPGQYEYKGVAGCTVRREAIGTGEVLAETSPGGDGLEIGRLTFSAPWFTGGSVLLKATCGGRDYTGTAYVISGGAVEAIQDDGVKRLVGSGNYQTIGFVNITLPVAAEPVTAPRVEIRIFQEDADGQRTDLKGATVLGTPIQVGVRAPGYVVREIKIRGDQQTIRVPDPLKNTKPKDPLAFDAILQDTYTPPSAGSYVIEATAMDPAQLTIVTGETVVQVLREPGGATESVPGRPGVIAARTVPRDGARGVSVSAFPQVDFTEPVKNIGPASVRLVPVGCAPPPEGSTSTEPTCTDSSRSEANPGDPVPLLIRATTPGPPPASIEITGTEVPAPLVTSLTLQPLVSLSFGTKYRLELTSAIVDEDGEQLVPYASRFSTFLPEDIGESKESDPPTVTGLVILGERGYVLETLHGGGVAGPQQASYLRVYDVTDPVEPRDMTGPTGFERVLISFPPRDIAGEEVKADDGSPTGQKLIAVATAPRSFYQVQGSDPFWTELKSTPANLFLYDVSDPDAKPRFAGAANITNNLVDGIPNRLFMQKGRIYAATFPKGIQVISTENLRAGFPTEGEPTGQDSYEINKKLFAGGLNPGAIVLTIPVKDPANGLNMPLNDLEVMDLSVWGVPRKVVAATGSRPQAALVLADAVSPYMESGDTQPKPLWLGPLVKDGSSLEWGGAIALTKINDIPHALVGGTGVIAAGGSQALLAIVDLSPVASAVPTGDSKPSPKVVAIVPLPKLNGVGDILLIGSTAVVSGGQGTSIDGQPGGAALVDFTDSAGPELVGYVAGVASRTALAFDSLVYSSHRSFVTGLPTELAGLKTATLDRITVITDARGHPLMLGLDRKSIEPQEIRYRAIGVGKEEDITSSVLELVGEGVVISSTPAPLDETRRGKVDLPAGIQYPPSGSLRARLIVNRGALDAPRPSDRLMRGEPFEIDVGEPVDMAADDDPYPISAVNQAILARLGRKDPPFIPPVLYWRPNPTPGAFMDPAVEAPKLGVYISDFTPLDVGVYRPELVTQEGVVLARSEAITVVPGLAKSVEVIRAEPPPSGTPGMVPADGKTEVVVVAGRILDRLVGGNLVPDGTPVQWSLESATGVGELLEQETSTAAGFVTARYRAGIEPGDVTIRLRVGEADAAVTIRQARLRVKVEEMPPGSYHFELTVDSDAGKPASDTPVVWGTEYGIVKWSPATVVDGAGTADWQELAVPQETVPYNNAHVFAVVGRSRDGASVLLPRFENQTGFRIRLDSYRIALDAAGVRMGGATVPSQTTARIEGGTPNSPAVLLLGSAHNPNVQPVALYPLDVVVDNDPVPDDAVHHLVTADAYDGPAASLAPDVEASSVIPAQGTGSLSFSGSGGLTLDDGPALALTSDFGFVGFVRFESLSPGQKVLEKAGSYLVQTVEEAGTTRLEFSIVQGTERKRVLSRQALAAATWYRFAAHHRHSRLYVAVGDAAVVDVADAGGPADASPSPLVFGGELTGQLDGISVYDFTRAPLIVFGNGAPQIEVPLNATGSAAVTVKATGQFFSPGPDAPQSFGIPMGISVSPDFPDREPSSLGAHIAGQTERSIKECAEGIATGENEEWSGVGCDISINLVPPLELGLAARDVVVAAAGFVRGKENVSYIAGAIGLATIVGRIVVKRFPVVGTALSRAVGAVAEASRPPWLRRKLTVLALEGSVEAAEGTVRAVDTTTVRVLSETAGTERREILDEIYRALPTELGDDLVKEFDEVAQFYGEVDVLQALGRIARKPGLGHIYAREVVHSLALLKRSGLFFQLSGDALEGMAVLAKRAPGNPAQRVLRLWSAVRDSGITNAKKIDVMNNFLGWIKQGDEVFSAIPDAAIRDEVLAGWSTFLRKTSNGGLKDGKAANLLVNSSKGAYHALDYMARRGFRDVVGIEVRAVDGRRVVDVLVRQVVNLPSGAKELIVKVELKNVLEGRSFPRKGEIAKDLVKALSDAAYLQSSGPVPEAVRNAVIEQLSGLVYVFRGNANVAAVAIAQLRRRIEQNLPLELKSLAQYVRHEILIGEVPF